VTETIRYSKVYLEDLGLGAGSSQVVLADGRVVTLSQVNLDLISNQLAHAAALLPYKVLGTRWYGLAGYNTFDEALDAIGSDTRTLLVTSATSITADTTVPTNVTLWVMGEGSFAVASGITLTLSGPLMAAFRTIFSGSGTVKFTYNVETYPEWWGGIGDGSTDSTTALQAAITSHPTQGGTLRLLAGTYNHSTTLTRTAPLQILGAGIDVSILQLTAGSSLLHGISGTTTLRVKDITVKTQTDVTSDYQMNGIRLNLDGTALTGRQIHIENVKVRGYNACLYCDGGTQYGIDRAIYRNVDLKANGPGTTYTGGGSCYMNRITQGEISLATIDQNNTGEHAIYCFGQKDIYLENLKITNASGTEIQAIKLVGDGVAANETFGTWSIRNVNFSDCTNGILIGTYGTEVLRAVTIDNIGAKDIDGTTNILGIVTVSAAGTSTINSVLVDNLYLENLGYQGCHCITGASSTIGRIEFSNIWAKNWSTASAGTYTLFGTSGTGTFNHIHLRNVYANGNSNGRTIVGSAGQASSVSYITWENLKEISTTAVGRPVSHTDDDTTPSMAIGTWHYINNSNPTTVTRLDDVQLGHIYTLQFANGNTTLDEGTGFLLDGGVDFVGSSHDFIQLMCTDDTAGATVMKQVSQASINS
jgi:hypothetical protein